MYKIYDEYTHPKSDKYRLKDFSRVKISEKEDLENPFPTEKEIIIRDLELNYDNISNRIKLFNDNISNLNQFIVDFQKSLGYVIDNGVYELKGRCIIDEKLSYKMKIKTRLCLR